MLAAVCNPCAKRHLRLVQRPSACILCKASPPRLHGGCSRGCSWVRSLPHRVGGLALAFTFRPRRKTLPEHRDLTGIVALSSSIVTLRESYGRYAQEIKEPVLVRWPPQGEPAVIMLTVLTVFVLATLAVAAPGTVKSRQAPTELLPAQIAAFHPYSQFSRAAGCSPDKTQNWTCGVPCDALPGFQPTTHGGDGNAEQFWYVGYHPPLKSVIVAHQGTNASEMLPILTDLHIRLESLNKTLFINAPDGVRVHRGFREEHERTADRILAAVQSTLRTHPDASVTCTGHSLGAALSQLDAVFLRSQLPSATSVKYVGYGCPRVGNRDYADYVDASLGDFTRINNKKDPVPILPPRFLTYRHPSGEIHIDAENRWLSCPGQDSSAVGCINEIGTIFNSTPSDHIGIVDGVPFNSCN